RILWSGDSHRRRRVRRRLGPQPRAFGAVPDPDLLLGRRAVRAPWSRVPGDAAGGGLRGRRGGALPVRRHDARRRLRRLAPGLRAISAAGGTGRSHPVDRDDRRGQRRRNPGRGPWERRAAGGSRRRDQYRGHRPGALHRLRLLLPGGRPGAAGGDYRVHRADASAQAQPAPPGGRRSGSPQSEDVHSYRSDQSGRGDWRMTIGLVHYLAVADILFTIGVFGIFVNRKNIIVILMSIELILLAVNINLVAFS